MNQQRRKSNLLKTVAVALALFATACGGSDTSASESSGNQVGEAPAGDSGSGGDGFGDQRPVFETSPGALSTDPVSAAKVYIGPEEHWNKIAPRVTQVVDTCEVLAVADLNAIADTLAEERALGGSHDFETTPLGSGCRYVSDTHAVMVVVGPADELTAERAGGVGHSDLDEIEAAPWASDAAVTTYTDDAFGIVTFFGAHMAAGDAAVMVYNSGGTGIDYGSDGEFFARAAQAAAPGIADAPPPGDVDPTLTTADPCGLYSADELEAFLGVPLGDPVYDRANGAVYCWWPAAEGIDRPVELRIEIIPSYSDDAVVDFEPIESGGSVILTPFDRAYLLHDGGVVEFDLTDWGETQTNPGPALVELAENLEARLA